MTKCLWNFAQHMLVRRRFTTTAARVSVGDALLAQLERVVHRVTTNASILDRHGDDESHHPSVPPSAVVYAQQERQEQLM